MDIRYAQCTTISPTHRHTHLPTPHAPAPLMQLDIGIIGCTYVHSLDGTQYIE